MSTAAKRNNAIRWTAIAVMVASIIVLTRILPFDRAIELVQDYVAELGWLGPIVFGAIYIIAAILFVPGSLLTLAAGAVFGLWIGTLTVAVSATSAAALAFLIARYALRSRIEELAATNKHFGAIDTAISEGGWKIVGLLRLSPAVPFSIINYLFGLTRVRFASYVATSLVAMLPGTFMYVYLGYAGRASAAGGRTVGEWVLLGVGLIATIVVSIYITRLAKKALAAKTALLEASGPERSETERAETKGSGNRGTFVLAAAAALSVALVGVAYAKKDVIASALGPPHVELAEKFAAVDGNEIFDHSALEAILTTSVDADGWVDYAAVGRDRQRLSAYTATLASADLDGLGRDERLAFYINAYNAYTLELIVENHPLASIKDIPREDRWDGVRWRIAGKAYSLNQIEHELIRGQFKEPRIHFAVNCASVGCPPLRREAFTGAKLEAQLADQTAYVHSHPRWFKFDPSTGTLKLTRLYQWYKNDFVQVADSVIDYAATHSPALAAAKKRGQDIEREWLDYGWELNSVENRPAAADGSEPVAADAPTPATPTAEPAAAPAEPVPAQPSAAKPVVAKKKATKKPPKQSAAKAKPKAKAEPKPAPTPVKKPEDKPKPKAPAGGGGGGSSGGGGSHGGAVPRGFR